MFTLQNQSSGDTIFLRFDRSSSPEALNTKKEESVVKQDVYLVRSLLYVFIQFLSTGKTFYYQPLIGRIVIKSKTLSRERLSLCGERVRNGSFSHLKHLAEKRADSSPRILLCVRGRQMAQTKMSPRKIELLATYSGFSRTFSLRDLAIIAKAVLAKSDRYLLLMQQCYWFTRTLVQISVAIYSPQSAGSINTGGLGRSGRINHLSFLPVINEDNPAEITLLVERVNRSISVDDQEVASSDIFD